MNQNSYTIFYTDDDTDDQDIFREIVQEINEQIYIFTQSTGDELISLLYNPPPRPRLVFLDLNMPIKNGYEVLKEIRRAEKTKHLPVVIFSTSNEPEAINYTRELGATMYINKPQSYTKLKNVLRQVLSLDWTVFKPAPDHYYFNDTITS